MDINVIAGLRLDRCRIRYRADAAAQLLLAR
jgi:hypothetical protein